MTPALKVSVDGGPYALAAGPDGAMWVTLVHGGAIARLSLSGELTIRELPTAAAGPVGIAATHDEAIQEVDLPGKPHAVVADPDDGGRISSLG